jgi:uncharacterized secreted protein with C-terminal beta-propeller domain
VKNQGYAPINNPTFTGTVTAPLLGKTQIDGGTGTVLTRGSGFLNIGNLDGQHVSIDNNEIQAKSNGTTPSILYLNDYGGDVSIGGPGSIVTAPTPAASTNNTQIATTAFVKAATVSKARKANVRVSLRHGDTWFAKTWTGRTGFYGYEIWTDGENIYCSYGVNQYVLNKATSTWIEKTWNGFTMLYGDNIWTDGENIYYNYGASQEVLNKATSTWTAKTWTGLTGFDGHDIWTDGENIYCSEAAQQYVLNKTTSTWAAKTWTGLTGFYGRYIWTDGDNIYYSYETSQYVLNKTTSTWTAKTWTGLTSFDGHDIWTDGENIYYNYGTNQYVLNKATSTWIEKTWTGLTSFSGRGIWTDGDNIYYSSGSQYQYVLPATRHNYIDDDKYNPILGKTIKCACSTLSNRFVFGNE